MKQFFSLSLFLALIIFNSNVTFGQRSVGGTKLDLDDNVGNHIFLTTLGSSFGINAPGIAPNVGALLDLSSTTKGLLVPRMNAGQEAGVATIAGMVLYNTTSNSLDVYNGSTWTPIGTGWSLAGNTGTNSAVNYIGTNDAQDFVVRTTGTERMRILSGGNMSISSSPGTAMTIAGPAATSINANGIIQTTGDFKTGSADQYFVPAGAERTFAISGMVNGATGGIQTGAGFTVSRTGVGQYSLSTNAGIGYNPFPPITITCYSSGAANPPLTGNITFAATFNSGNAVTGTSTFGIEVRDRTGALVDPQFFNFVIVCSR